ncbi:O-antigen polymerase [Kocuria rhizophila]|uniref:O-antigen polymerase n=1 Tax=Kocuria rhizophila TaxID=72000 RepID=UPI00073D9515|nr:O-antigen polymerase [Kocuria rhizophila]
MGALNPVAATVLLLSASVVVGVLALVHIWTRRQDGLNLRTWMVANFLLANVVSGFAHVLGWSKERGYYEVLTGDPVGSSSGLLTAGWATFLGSLALWAGLMVPRPRLFPVRDSRKLVPPRPLVPENLYSFAAAHRITVGGLALVLAGAGALGVSRVMGATTDQTGGRIISVDDGNARFAFLAGWLPWAVTVLVLTLASRRRQPGPSLWNTALLVGGLGGLALGGSWNGGRAELVYAAFPLMALMLPRINVLRWPFLAAGGIAFTAFLIYTTSRRVGGTTDPWSFLDWQWGRFSMSAWASNHTAVHGSLGGETVWSALLNVPLALLHFAGINADNPFRSMVKVSGYDLLGGEDQIYVVPGFSAEMLLNFGLVGVVAGYFVLGLFSAVVSDAYSRSRSETNRLLLATIGSTLVFQGIVGQLESFEVFVTLSILPLWGLWVAERVFGSPSDGGQPLVPVTSVVTTPHGPCRDRLSLTPCAPRAPEVTVLRQ